MLSEQIFLDILKEKYKIGAPELKKYKADAERLSKSLEEYCLSENIIDETEVYSEAAKRLELPFIAIKGKEIKKEILNLVPAPLAQAHQVVAFEKTNQDISLAMLDPLDIQTIEFIRRKTGLEPKVFVTAPGDIKDALRRYHADLEQDISITQIAEGKKGEEGDLKKAAQELPIVNIVNSVLDHAVYEGASDIHIEPMEKEVGVRYRIDGELRNVMTLPKAVANGMCARIKILSNLKIDEHMVPQDGRFKIQLQEERFSFRVSIIPVYDGEKIVLRLLKEGQKPLTLDELGFQAKPKQIVEDALGKPHGMVLVTGPTGSGKTTTLYSMLGILNQPGVNISTIEDPIEYHLKGVNQSQINPRVGFTFAIGLRAFLRQDPDIIMVGEIRDQETGEIAVHAALTGHLVLSTLHTNDAPTTIPRLLDMGIPPFLVAFTMNIIIAQRLVRKICEFCKKEYTLEKAAIKELQKVAPTEKLVALFKENDIQLSAKETSLESMTFYRGEGCRRCNQSGFKGRIGIYEVLEMDKELTKQVNARATANEIRDYAIAHGMVTMMQDGLMKAKQGVTTLEEVIRATRD